MLFKLGRVGLLAALSMLRFRVRCVAVLRTGPERRRPRQHSTMASMTTHPRRRSRGDGEPAAKRTCRATDGHGDPPGTPPLLSIRHRFGGLQHRDLPRRVCDPLQIRLASDSRVACRLARTRFTAISRRPSERTLEARALLADYQAKLDDSATQVQAMLAEARKDAEATGQRIVEEAKAEAERQRERAIADIETAKKVALVRVGGPNLRHGNQRRQAGRWPRIESQRSCRFDPSSAGSNSQQQLTASTFQRQSRLPEA